jgi:hypothetical protein
MAPIPTIKDAFFDRLRKLVGRKCWGFVAGSGTGSMVALDFGGRVPRRQRLQNSCLTSEQQRFTGEYSLFVSCSWRLDGHDTVLCGCEDSNVEGGPMLTGLRSLVGQMVIAVEISPQGCDLVFVFGNGLSLRVFCEHTDNEEQDDNYSFFVPGLVYTVGCRSVLTVEARTESDGCPIPTL